jgi:hypothetical protein
MSDPTRHRAIMEAQDELIRAFRVLCVTQAHAERLERETRRLQDERSRLNLTLSDDKARLEKAERDLFLLLTEGETDG